MCVTEKRACARRTTKDSARTFAKCVAKADPYKDASVYLVVWSKDDARMMVDAFEALGHTKHVRLLHWAKCRNPTSGLLSNPVIPLSQRQRSRRKEDTWLRPRMWREMQPLLLWSSNPRRKHQSKLHKYRLTRVALVLT